MPADLGKVRLRTRGIARLLSSLGLRDGDEGRSEGYWDMLSVYDGAKDFHWIYWLEPVKELKSNEL